MQKFPFFFVREISVIWTLKGFYRAPGGSKEGSEGAKTSPDTFLRRQKQNMKNLGRIDFSCISIIFRPLRACTEPRGVKKGGQNEFFGLNLQPRVVSSYSKCKKFRYHLVLNFPQEFPFSPNPFTSPFSLPQTSQKSQNCGSGRWLFW